MGIGSSCETCFFNQDNDLRKADRRRARRIARSISRMIDGKIPLDETNPAQPVGLGGKTGAAHHARGQMAASAGRSGRSADGSTADRKRSAEWVCRPDSVRRLPDATVIPLGGRLPDRSSHQPARSGGPPCPAGSRIACLFGVAPGGVWRATGVATGAVSAYLTISPLPALTDFGGIFLFHFPSPSTFRPMTPGR